MYLDTDTEKLYDYADEVEEALDSVSSAIKEISKNNPAYEDIEILYDALDTLKWWKNEFDKKLLEEEKKDLAYMNAQYMKAVL